MSTSSRFLTTGVLALTAVLAAIGVAGPAQASPSHFPQPGSTYVALGSSYAAGGNLAPLDPADDGGFCGRSAAAYPKLLARTLRLNLVNATCGGATTANLLTTPQTVQNENGTRTLPVQLDAVTADTDLVTITIGGNDISYIGTLTAESCRADLAANPTSPLSLTLQQYGLCTPPDAAATAAALGELQTRLTNVVRAVQAKAPSARIVLVDYLTVLPADGSSCAVMPIGAQKQKEIRKLATGLSTATQRAAGTTGVAYAAASSASRSHDVCSRAPWVTGYAPESNLMHPNAAGQAVAAGLVVRELLR